MKTAVTDEITKIREKKPSRKSICRPVIKYMPVPAAAIIKFTNVEMCIRDRQWPEYDEEKCREDEIEVAVQINGKVRDRITIPAGSEAADAIANAKASEKIVPFLDGKQIVKEIYVKGKLVNIVAK